MAAELRDYLISLQKAQLDAIACGDYEAYAESCSPDVSCFEPEALGHLVVGLVRRGVSEGPDRGGEVNWSSVRAPAAAADSPAGWTLFAPQTAPPQHAQSAQDALIITRTHGHAHIYTHDVHPPSRSTRPTSSTPPPAARRRCSTRSRAPTCVRRWQCLFGLCVCACRERASEGAAAARGSGGSLGMERGGSSLHTTRQHRHHTNTQHAANDTNDAHRSSSSAARRTPRRRSSRTCASRRSRTRRASTRPRRCRRRACGSARARRGAASRGGRGSTCTVSIQLVSGWGAGW